MMDRRGVIPLPAAKADALLTHWLDLDRVDTVFVCGPDGMMRAVAEALKARGYPDAQVRIERFATSVPRHEHRSSKPVEAGRTACEVTVVLEGVQLLVSSVSTTVFAASAQASRK